MPNYDITEIVERVSPEQPKRYTIKTYRTVKDRAGKDVEIIANETQIERQQLINNKTEKEAEIALIDEQIAKIDTLESAQQV